MHLSLRRLRLQQLPHEVAEGLRVRGVHGKVGEAVRELSLGPAREALQVDPQGVQNFFASRARAPLDLQVTFDTVSVQLERLITSHREMMASLQTVQAEQAVLKREMESRR